MPIDDPGFDRHHDQSALSHGGTDIEVIVDAMGHRNSVVTRTVYRHALADRISAAANVFDEILPAQAPRLGSQRQALGR